MEPVQLKGPGVKELNISLYCHVDGPSQENTSGVPSEYLSYLPGTDCDEEGEVSEGFDVQPE